MPCAALLHDLANGRLDVLFERRIDLRLGEAERAERGDEQKAHDQTRDRAEHHAQDGRDLRRLVRDEAEPRSEPERQVVVTCVAADENETETETSALPRCLPHRISILAGRARRRAGSGWRLGPAKWSDFAVTCRRPFDSGKGHAAQQSLSMPASGSCAVKRCRSVTQSGTRVRINAWRERPFRRFPPSRLSKSPEITP